MKKVLLGLSTFLFLTLSAQASEYALYSPTTNVGTVGSDGTWQITDPCAASQAAQA